MIRAAIASIAMLNPAVAPAQTESPAPVVVVPPPAAPAPSTVYHDAPIFPIGPIGDWEVHQDSGGFCAVSRNYGSAERPETVTIQARPMTPKDLTIFVVSNATGAAPRDGRATVSLSPGTAIPATYSSFDVPVRDQHFSVLYLDRLGLEHLQEARTVTLQADRTRQIPASEIRAAIAAADRCMAELYRSWGIDPARFAAELPVSRPLGGGPGTWFNADEDYPAKARIAGTQGRVVILLDVGKDGVVKSCHVIQSADADLDAATCQSAMKHASYAPALDAQGKPTATLAVIPVRWSIEP